MCGSHAGRWYNRPVRIEPDRGKVCEYGIECPQIVAWSVSQTDRAGFHVASGGGSEDSGDILEDHQSGLKFGDGADDLRPEAGAGAIAQAGAGACHRHVLAREAGAEDLDEAAPRPPVDEGDVAQVGRVWKPMCEDRARGAVGFVVADGDGAGLLVLGELADVGHKHGLGAECVVQGEVEATDA